MKRDEVTGSKNFNADDLRDGDLTLVVSEVTQEEFKAEDGYKQKKVVVAFRGRDKRLVCGKTKANALFDMLGEDTEDWIGQRIRLTLGKTNFQGKRVDCVEVKEPLPAKASPRDNGSARRPAPAQVAAENDQVDDGEAPF